MTEEQKRCADHSGFQEKFDAQEAFIARLKENETKMMEAIARMVPTHVLQYLILVLIPLFGGIFGLQAAIYQKITSVSTRIAVIETVPPLVIDDIVGRRHEVLNVSGDSRIVS